MNADRAVRAGIYSVFAADGIAPDPTDLGVCLGLSRAEVLASFQRLAAAHLVVLEPDAATIRMASPFSAVPTPHTVESAGVRYFANCAWDAFGIPAALGRPAIVRSRCGVSQELLRLEVNAEAPPESSWVFHTPVAAARWWDDIIET